MNTMRSNFLIETHFPSTGHGFDGNEGLTVIETLVASTILALGVMGTVSMFQWAAQGESSGWVQSKALALLESRLEAKRTGGWKELLMDDLDGDGVTELSMLDDGQGWDAKAGDGTYTAETIIDDVQLVWTIALSHPGPLGKVGSVHIEGVARAKTIDGKVKTVRMGFIRTNPRFVGKQ